VHALRTTSTRTSRVVSGARRLPTPKFRAEHEYPHQTRRRSGPNTQFQTVRSLLPLFFPLATTKPTQRITAKKVRILRKRTDQNVSLRRNFNHFRSERFLNFLGIRKVFEVFRQVGFLVWPAGKSRGADLGEIVQFEFPRSKETVFARVRARLRFIRASATGNAPTSPRDAAGRAFSVRSSQSGGAHD